MQSNYNEKNNENEIENEHERENIAINKSICACLFGWMHFERTFDTRFNNHKRLGLLEIYVYKCTGISKCLLAANVCMRFAAASSSSF